MKYLWSIVVILLIAIGYSFTTKTTDPMEQTIQDTVLKFATAIEQNNESKLDDLLHKNFRVVANRYPTPDVTTILDKMTYLKLIAAKKIGGKAYEVDIRSINIEEHTATVVAKFTAQGSFMNLTLLLVQSLEGDWEIITDMAIIG